MYGNEFLPNWASAPGDTIADILRERNLSAIEFAQQIGYTGKDVTDMLQGRATITLAIARQLERALGASVEFWMSRDFQYRQDITRLQAINEEWLDELPIGDMIRFGWLKQVPHPSEEVTACLKFFDVPSIRAWREKYTGLFQMVAFRTSSSFDSQPGAVATWLRQCELEATGIECGPWNPKQFRETLSNIRSLTQFKDPHRFLPELKKRCSESGVAVVIVRAPSGCRASGATRFLSPDKALLLLSFRYLSDDQFWFTFFHEAGHLILHNASDLFLEGTDMLSNVQEEDANRFAADILVPAELKEAFINLRADYRQVIRFALRVGIAPGVVVGQMQHYGRIGQNQLNRLKRRYKWED